MKDKYQLIIIGGGAGGVATAIKANELKISTLIINSILPLGGTCVNVGCVPSKYMIERSKYIFDIKNPRFDSITISDLNFNFKDIVDSQIKFVESMREEKYEKVLSSLENVDFLEGKASFVSEKKIIVKDKIIEGGKFIIAVGSTANIPQIPGIEEIDYITHIEALHMKDVPEDLIVIGSGAVALEFAQMYSHLGSNVTMIVRGDKLFKETEPEISEYIEKYFIEEGIKILKNTNVLKFEKTNNHKGIAYTERNKIIFDKVLFAIGKTPNTANLNLEKAKVVYNNNLSIKVDKFLATSNPDIYAVGDVNDLPKRLETTAGREGTIAVLNSFEKKNAFIDYNLVPYGIFTHPSIAGVGILDKDVSSLSSECLCLTLDFDKVPKAKIINDTRGFIKMIINKENEEILGIHLISHDAVDIIHEASLVVKNKMKVSDLSQMIHIFPTLSEVFKLVSQSYQLDLSNISCCI
jgi:mercuric reductase